MRLRWERVTVLAVLLLALILRCYHLDAQSVGGDDLLGAFFALDSLDCFLKQFHIYAAEYNSFPFVMQFFASGFLGGGEIGGRRFSVLMGVVAVALMYALGRRLAGPRVGLFGALLMAISPEHIFYSQSFSAYPLVEVLALVSMIGLVLWRTGAPRSGIALHAMANLALMWSHKSAMFLFPAEGLILLSFPGPLLGRGLRLGLWTGAHMAALLVNHFLQRFALLDLPNAYDMFEPASFKTLFSDFFADDAVYWNMELATSGPKTWLEAHQMARNALLAGGSALVGALTLGTLWFIGGTLSRRFRPADEGECRPWPALWLLLWWAVPVVALAILSHAYLPFFFPRYTRFTLPALYLMMGILVAGRGRGRSLRRVFCVGLVIFFASQTALLLGSNVRTNWKSAAAALAENAREGDICLIAGETVYQYYLAAKPRPPLPIVNAPADMDYTEQALNVIDRLQRMPLKEGAAPAIHLLAVRPYIVTPWWTFDQGLKDRGLSYRMNLFVAGQHVYYYQIPLTGQGNAAADTENRFPIGDWPAVRHALEEKLRCGTRLLGGLTDWAITQESPAPVSDWLSRLQAADLLTCTGMMLWDLPEADIQAGRAGLVGSLPELAFSRYLEVMLGATLDDEAIWTRAGLQHFLKTGSLPKRPTDRARACLYRGLTNLRRGRLEVALSDFSQGRQWDTDLVSFSTGATTALLALGRFDEAAAKLQEARGHSEALAKDTAELQDALTKRDGAALRNEVNRLESAWNMPFDPNWLRVAADWEARKP